MQTANLRQSATETTPPARPGGSTFIRRVLVNFHPSSTPPSVCVLLGNAVAGGTAPSGFGVHSADSQWLLVIIVTWLLLTLLRQPNTSGAVVTSGQARKRWRGRPAAAARPVTVRQLLELGVSALILIATARLSGSSHPLVTALVAIGVGCHVIWWCRRTRWGR